MEHNDNDTSLPSRLPAPRNFSTPELEAVIRRALELQAGTSAHADDGVAEADIVRIGQELGLDPAAVRRAMAEVRTRAPVERGALDGFIGSAAIRAARVIERPAAEVTSALDLYLRDVEFMVVQRRYAERTRYVHDTSVAAGLSRFAKGFSRGHQPLKVSQLDVAVSPLDARSSLVELGIDLTATRGSLIAGVFGTSSVAATGWAVTVWATPVADPLMLLGLPVLAGAWAGMRAIYRTIARSSEDKLELLLDRLQRHEIR